MYTSVMSTTVTVSEARATLPDIVERVLAGEEITLTRHGQPVAVVVRPDSLKVRRAADALDGAATIHAAIERGRNARLTKRATISAERADALVAAVRASRSRR
jgi:prevent-host-death family protein